MDDEGIRLASIERVVQGGGEVSNNGAQFLLDRLQTAEARAAEAEAVIAEAPHEAFCRWDRIDAKKPECTCRKSRYRAGADQ